MMEQVRAGPRALYNAQVFVRRSRSYLLEDPGHRTSEADRLDRQARLLFPLERESLVHHGLAGARTILDLGCGQGSYLSLIGGSFSGTRCIGLDRHAGLLAEAIARPEIAAVAVCDLAERSALLREMERHQPDLALCRFVLQHMSADERRAMLGALAEHAARRSFRLVLVDVDAASSFLEPPSPLVAEAREGLNQMQARMGGDRRVGAQLGQILREAGFEDVRLSRVSVDSRAIGFTAWWSAFGSLLCAGLRYRPAAQEALREWGADAATAASWRAGFDVCIASSAAPRGADG